MVEPTPSRAADPAGLVVLVRGDVEELDALRAAWLAAEMVGSPLVGAVLPDPRPGLDLLRVMAGEAVTRWLDWRDLVIRVAGSTVRCLVVAAATWRAAARAIWPAVERCAVYIQHRRPAVPARHVLLAVDSAGTNAALARHLANLPLGPGIRVTVGHAARPSWACSLAGALGYAPEVVIPGWEPTLPWPPVPPDAGAACVYATPLWGIRALAHELHPDLVVLGLHAHRLRRPSLAHPTAWVLSRELETDVALCPLERDATLSDR
ncbi:MAG TPA: universal stress protein [Candidatus Dormibacteraeota bacterium]|nr:universal stress protein [Candidatus Dormibacteraeota bacterium]